jgi:Apea-like HEPN
MADSAPKSIFIAFTGPEIAQSEAKVEFGPGYECWNLKKVELESFISALQQSIPPINANVLNNYRASDTNANPDFGLRQVDYDACSWGLLLPDTVPRSFGGGYGETLFLLNLYSPHFLRPVFYATDFGIYRPRQPKNAMLFFHNQKQAERFSRAAFVDFHRALIAQSVYAIWQADRVARWSKEQWRLFVACLLYSELQQYENSKQVFIWQRESADLATILEALFTAGESDTTEVVYKLRKRSAALLSFQLPDIEKDVKELYKQRSTFVHGSFFRQIHKETRIVDGFAQLPPPPFEFLYRQKEHVRLALIAYLNLNKLKLAGPALFPACKNVLEILEQVVIDVTLRSAVEDHTSEILRFL